MDAKRKYFTKSGIYICICHFFFVSLRPNLLCACIDVYAHKEKHSYMIYTNDEAIEVLRDIIERHNVGRLLVVHGKNSYMACGGNELMSQLNDVHNMEIANFSDFSANPKIEDVMEGAKVIEEILPHAIVAIGGGSAMDVAKLMRYEAQKTYIPLIAIPTTSGTGAEATQFSVCYVNGKKESFDYPELLPNYSLLIPELTMKNNRYLTACTGFDALAQAIESYWNIHSTSESEQYAEKAIAMLFDALSRFADDAEVCMNDYEWRAQMMEGANLAGKAINITRTTAPHAMSYVMTSKYGYPHGHAVALSFPYFANLNINCDHSHFTGSGYEHYAEKMQWLRQSIGIGNQNIVNYMKRFLYRIGLNYDWSRRIDADVVAQAVNIERAKNNPYQLDGTILKEAAASILIDL